MTTTVYVVVLEYECEPSTLLGVYSTKERAMEVRSQVDAESYGSAAVFEVSVDDAPMPGWGRHKEVQP